MSDVQGSPVTQITVTPSSESNDVAAECGTGVFNCSTSAKLVGVATEGVTAGKEAVTARKEGVTTGNEAVPMGARRPICMNQTAPQAAMTRAVAVAIAN